jgi:hypothetical protein
LNGKTCFLHEDRWQKVIEAAIRDDPLVSPHQEHLAIKLWSIFSKGPNLFKEVQDLVLSCRPAPCGSRENLITQMVKEQGGLEDWLVLTGQHKSDTARHTAQELAKAPLPYFTITRMKISGLSNQSLDELSTEHMSYAV